MVEVIKIIIIDYQCWTDLLDCFASPNRLFPVLTLALPRPIPEVLETSTESLRLLNGFAVSFWVDRFPTVLLCFERISVTMGTLFARTLGDIGGMFELDLCWWLLRAEGGFEFGTVWLSLTFRDELYTTVRFRGSLPSSCFCWFCWNFLKLMEDSGFMNWASLRLLKFMVKGEGWFRS